MKVQDLLCIFFSICAKIVLSAYCDKETLQFSGLQKGGTRLYLSGEGFVPSCDDGYQVTRPGERIICRNGIWRGHFPPCVVVSCLRSPPPISNGRVKSYTGTHANVVEYECDNFFFLAFESTIQCLFGEWKGMLPVCQDSRCHFKNIRFTNGIVPNKNITFNGEFLSFQCMEGFVPTGTRPLCSRGSWIEDGISPCKEMDCFVDGIDGGTLMEVQERNVWKWSKFRTERKEAMIKVNKGVTRSSGYQLHIICEPKDSFQGKGIINITTTCIRGKWQPQPICLTGRN